MPKWPMGLTPRRGALTFVLNQSKRFGLNRRKRGCPEILRDGIDRAAGIALENFPRIAAHTGDLNGKIGLEIGPGDNLALAHCFLANGAAKIYAIEKHPSVRVSKPLADHIRAHFRSACASEPDVQVRDFENFDGPRVDFVYSIDVIEHVSDVRAAFAHIARILKPNGVSIHSIDFAGHNAFAGTRLDFLTCPDGVWNLLHSHLITTNRIRFGEALSCMKDAGLEVEAIDILEQADDEYVESLRPSMIDRYRNLPVEDLKVLQAVVCARKYSQEFAEHRS
jgi:SAM-dependent methyltransferase